MTALKWRNHPGIRPHVESNAGFGNKVIRISMYNVKETVYPGEFFVFLFINIYIFVVNVVGRSTNSSLRRRQSLGSSNSDFAPALILTQSERLFIIFFRFEFYVFRSHGTQ